MAGVKKPPGITKPTTPKKAGAVKPVTAGSLVKKPRPPSAGTPIKTKSGGLPSIKNPQIPKIGQTRNSNRVSGVRKPR